MKKRNMLTSVVTLLSLTLVGIPTYLAHAEETIPIKQSVEKNVVTKKELYSLESHEGLSKSGTSRGLYHDRQDIGIILKRGSSIDVKTNKENPQFASQVTMEFLADTRVSEKSVTVTSEWQTVKTDHDVAVFFKTPFDVSGAEIEYKLTGETLLLPVFEYGTNESEFFNVWDKQDAPFALIKSTNMQMLVPTYAKENVRNLKDFHSVEELATHYDRIIDFADENLGLDSSENYHAVTNRKYFIKEDKNTSAGGYYGDEYTVCTKNSFENFWLREIAWGKLHEIHHGYQPNYKNIGITTGEVSNNLYNIHYLKKYHSVDVIKDGWLFNYGKQEQSEAYIEKELTLGTHYNSLGGGERPALILLTMVDQKAGDDALKKLNQTHRSSYFNDSYVPMNLQDRLIESYGDTSHYDFSPAIQRWNVPIDYETSETSRLKYRPVAHLDHVVPKEYQAEVMQKFDEQDLISSRFQVVDNDDIAFLDLTGNITIQLNDALFKKLQGEELYLKDGNQIIAKEQVSNKNVLFRDIPNGVYAIGSSKKTNQLSTNYVYIKDSEQAVTIKEEKLDTFIFLGYSDSTSGILSVNSGDEKQLLFNKFNTLPHSYFQNELYYSIAVYRKGKEIYTKEVMGTDNEKIADELDLKKNDVIKIYHAETRNRLLTKDTSLIDTKEKNHYLQVLNGELKRINSTLPEEEVPENSSDQETPDSSAPENSLTTSSSESGSEHTTESTSTGESDESSSTPEESSSATTNSSESGSESTTESSSTPEESSSTTTDSSESGSESTTESSSTPEESSSATTDSSESGSENTTESSSEQESDSSTLPENDDSTTNSSGNESDDMTCEGENHEQEDSSKITIDIYAENTYLAIGETQKLIPVIVPEPKEELSLSWYSEQPEVAEISADGTVTAKRIGETVITLTNNDTGQTKEISITVQDQPLPKTGEKKNLLLFYEGVVLFLSSATLLITILKKHKSL